MALRNGNREEMVLFPPCFDDYVKEDDPVRAYDAIIDALDLDDLGLSVDSNKVGNSSYNPISMLKLLVYGYSYGWRSSRKLERAVHHNLSFIWLIGGLKPDHKTISNFRKNNKNILQKVLKQTVRICLKLNLIEGNCLFVDGTKMRGSASISKTFSKSKLEDMLSEIDKRIDSLSSECDQIDLQESGSYISTSKDLHDMKSLKTKISGLIDKMEKENLASINLTDPDTKKVKGRQGTHAGFNGQIVTDESNGLIVSADVVKESTDHNQFSEQIENANKNLGKNCKTAVADAGYSKVENLSKTSDKGIDVIVPSNKQALHIPTNNPFDKDKFIYDKKDNQYKCPEGSFLKLKKYRKDKEGHVYQVAHSKQCLNCKHFGKCTTNKRGREIHRKNNEELKIKFENRYSEDDAQKIYSKRKERVEHQFGHIKRNLNGGHFLVRGVEAVKAEFAVLTSCFNIARMITLLGGVSSMVEKLKTV